MESKQKPEDGAPAAPPFLVKATDRAKLAGNRALTTGEPIGKVIEAAVNEFTAAVFDEGYGYSHNSFAGTFLAQAKDNALMREALAAIMVKVEQEGAFRDASAIKTVLQSLAPLPS